MTRLRRRLLSCTCASGVLVLVACGSDPSSSPVAGTPSVVATTSIWADIVGNVACDGLADVVTVVPLGGDPHAFEPSIRDRERMENAVLVVANGMSLEESLTDTIDAVEANGTPVLRAAEHLDPLPLGDDTHDEVALDDGDHGDHDHGDFDPHVWWDPSRVSLALPTIADALTDAGLDRAALDVCIGRYGEEVDALDDEVASIVATLPSADRLLVTNHDSLGYFADRYDFEVIGTVIPSSSTLAGSNPSALDDLAAKITATGVPAIFAETQHPSADARALARRIGGVEVVTFATDTLGEPGTPTGDYLGWLATNARTIVDALTRDEGE